jgi:hypothetical protein
MAHEIEADFVSDWGNEATQCQRCTSFKVLADGRPFCSEAQAEVPPTAHCDFFQAID